MIEKREHGWRTQQNENTLIRSEYDDMDVLTFSGEEISVSIESSTSDISQVLAAASALETHGLSPKGCYNCLMFSRSGAQVDDGGTLGYCLDGKIGENVNMSDATAMTDSCKRQILASPTEQQIKTETWRLSLSAKLSE